MGIRTALDDQSRVWTRKPPATIAVINKLVAESTVELPNDFLAFLALSNGGCGSLACPAYGFDLWPAEDLLKFNAAYETSTYIPGFIGFGSNGAGELLAFDTRQGQPYPIVMVPFIPMDSKCAKVIAADFIGFLNLLGREFRAD